MTEMIERALEAFLREGENWMMFSSAGGNTPTRVYRMVNAVESDTPAFIGPDMDCSKFVLRHQLQAAIAAYEVSKAYRKPTVPDITADERLGAATDLGPGRDHSQ